MEGTEFQKQPKATEDKRPWRSICTRPGKKNEVGSKRKKKNFLSFNQFDGAKSHVKGADPKCFNLRMTQLKWCFVCWGLLWTAQSKL